MRKAVAIADRTTDVTLGLIAAGNVVFLVSFLVVAFLAIGKLHTSSATSGNGPVIAAQNDAAPRAN